MAEYKTRFSNDQKRKKLAKFNAVYYDGDPENWKVSRLPNWMEFYGYELDRELKGVKPSYYRKFKQGTIVMIDYGVPVGTELGGRHFGVVLSNNDNKYKSKILVVPLSSKYHKGYEDLGFDLMQGILELTNKRLNEIYQELDDLNNRVDDFSENKSPENFSKSIRFSPEEIQFLQENKVDLTPFISKKTILDIGKGNTLLKDTVHNIKQSESWKRYPTIFEFVSFLEAADSFQKEILNRSDKLREMVKQMNALAQKLKKYNKRSFGVISDVKSVSKLKVVKFNHYSISGNTHVSDLVLSKLKLALLKSIE